jgi:PAS domain S-box-containing protein
MTPSTKLNPTELPEYHRLLFDQAGMAMVAADLKGYITSWNHAARRMFGGAGSMIGADWTRLIPHEARPEAERLLGAALRDGAVGEFEFSLRDEQGAQRRLATIVTPVSDAKGHRIGGLACVRDITNRMRLQERLAQQTKMAALGELAGGLSHHFNNILGGIVMSVDFALASGNEDMLRKVLERTAGALNRATGLMDSLLAFAQGDFRDASLAELGEVVIDVVKQTEPRMSALGIMLDVRLNLIPVIAVPRSPITTVLTNLVDNAIEAMPDGGTLTIALDADEHFATIQIADTGCGLTDEALNRIFQPFFSTKKACADRESGRGLGLAVAHGIVKVLHGSVEVTSTVGEGTLFEVRLPLPGVATGL